MLTLFTVPKPFRGHIGDIQRNALESWRALRPAVQIVLVGDEEGVEQAAREHEVEHASGLVQNERGTPRLDSAFERVGTIAREPLWCLVNTDIVLLDDFVPAIQRVRAAFERFLVVGESRDLAVRAELGLHDAAVRAELRQRALDRGRLRGYAAMDYFVFPRDHFGRLPPFLIGRACFDNWLVWRARQVGPVVDATRSIVSVHQAHDYSHVPGGFEESYYGEEAKHNERLAGGRDYIYSLHDATHRLHPKGPPLWYLGSAFRARENARKARVKLELQMRYRRDLRRLRKSWAAERRRVRVVAVFPEPTPYRTPLLDAVAGIDEIELSVLYAARTVAGRTWSMRDPEHTHWVMRSFRLPGAQRVLRHDYPVNWAIWRALYRLRPECVVVSGWSTFAAQAAIAWCRLNRIPYLLVVESHDRDERPAWRRTIKGSVVPRVVRGAAGILVTGSLARESMLAHGANPARIRVFANTVDVTRFGAKADDLGAERPELRAAAGLDDSDIAVLCVARLAPEKGIDTLLRAAAQLDDRRLAVVLAGEGPERERLTGLADELAIRLVLLGDVGWDHIVETYVTADIFALLSEREPWGVVVNEAAACGLPLVLTDAVGAAHDLLIDGENGRVVPVRDVAAAASALAELVDDPSRRAAWGARSRSLATGWGYEQSVRGLLELAELARDERWPTGKRPRLRVSSLRFRS